MFLFDEEDEDNDEDENDPKEEKKDTTKHIIGELEIMIARKDARGQGLARETLLAFMWYITSSLSAILSECRVSSSPQQKNQLKYLRVKIDKENLPSIKLFQGIGFTRTSPEPNFFGEVELRTPVVNGRLMNVEGTMGVQVLARKLVYGGEDT